MAVLVQPETHVPARAVLEGIERGEMNARFEGIDLNEIPLWRGNIKPRLLSGEINHPQAREIFMQHYATK